MLYIVAVVTTLHVSNTHPHRVVYKYNNSMILYKTIHQEYIFFIFLHIVKAFHFLTIFFFIFPVAFMPFMTYSYNIIYYSLQKSTTGDQTFYGHVPTWIF